jgi:hypothetical protein
MPDAAPRPLALLALVNARFYGDGPHPLQLVCTTEDASDAECDQAIALVEPGTEWDELEARIVAHAAEHHAAAAPRPLTAPDVVAGLLADVAEARDQLADVQRGAGEWIRETVARETAGLTAQLAAVTGERDKAYHERAALVAYLAACQPSAIVWGADPAAPGWPVIFADSDAVGQMSWHLAPGDLGLFGHVGQMAADGPDAPQWDGHTTDEKYARLAELTRMIAANLNDPLRVEAAAAHGRIGALTAQLREVTQQNERNYADAVRNAEQLADVEASLGAARHVVRVLLGAFVKTGSGWAAKRSGTVLARLAGQAGVDAPDGSGDEAGLPPKWAPADWKQILKRLHGLVREALCETEWDPGQIRQWLSDHGVPDLDDEAEDGADA